MKNKYSYFEQLCALSYLSLGSNNPRGMHFQDVKRCSDVLNNR